MKTKTYNLIFLFLLAFNGQLFAQNHNINERADLFEIPLEELLQLEVEITTSARRPQPLGRATHAMYIITAEDIRQAGVVKLDDLLRLVPGMDVVQTNNRSFATSARGFAKERSRRMQLLLDGRPMYDGFKGGADLVFHPFFLENIERIEVIRGPGGVTWGVNAMNGVINIITKKAADTQGGFVYGGFGNRELYEGHLRIGGTKGNLAWRGSVGANHDNGFGTGGGDDKKDWLSGFTTTGRADYQLNADTMITLTGGHKFSTLGGTTSRHRSMQYMNLIWEKTLAENSTFQVRWSEYYNAQLRPRDSHDLFVREDMVEIQHNFFADSHSIVWGADWTRDVFHVDEGASEFTDPDSFYNDQASAFIEDEITLADNLWFTIGYRGHYNELTHFDWAGKLALVWEAAPKHFFRAAISRAFRRPLFNEEFGDEPTTKGNDSLRNERIVAYELGYRGKLAKNLELNIEGFFNRHKDLMGTELVGGIKKWQNTLDTKTYGLETSIDWKPCNWWLVRASHSYEHQTQADQLNRQDETHGKLFVFRVPKHKVGLTNRFYLDKSTTLNTQLFWSDTYFDGDTSPDRIDSYFRFDFRLARRIWNDAAEVAFGVTNLTSHFHDEFGSTTQKVPRQIYFQFFYEF